jgi:predicted nucleic acid-binding protein
MYLLDTNVISEFRRPRPHAAVVAWLASVAAEHMFVSAVTLGEIQAGV